ncbi:MAG: hypothetical protein ACYDHZ_00625 [Dehalococcoidia bacterium]
MPIIIPTMAICKWCDPPKDIPGQGGLFRHYRDVHPREFLALQAEAHAKRWKDKPLKAPPLADPPSPPVPKEERKSDGQGQASTPQTAVGAVTFAKGGSVEFNFPKALKELEFEHMWNAWMMYKDIQLNTGIKDSFSVAIEDAMAIAWRMTVPSVPNWDGDHDGAHETAAAPANGG